MTRTIVAPLTSLLLVADDVPAFGLLLL